MHRVLPVLLLTACAAVNTPEACRVAPVASIPIRMAGTIPLLDVRINGHSARLMLDTGAEGTVVAAEAFDRLGLRQDYAHAAYNVGLGATTANWQTQPVVTRLGTFDLPAAALGVTSFGWKLEGENRPDGLLGSGVLSGYDVDVDMPRRRLTLYEPRRCPGGPPPFEGPATTIAAAGQGAYKLTIPVTLDGAPLTAEIDTGASTTMVTAAGAALAEAALAADRTVHVSTGDPVGSDVRLHRFERLVVGGDQVTRPLLLVTERIHPAFAMLLGSDYWRRRRLWLSYAGRSVTIGPAQPLPR